MAVSIRVFTAAWLAVMVSVGASAAEPITGTEIKGFISSFPELKALAERRRIDFEKGGNQPQGRGRESFSPFSQGIGKLRQAGAYGEATLIVRRHGFSSMESWAGTADRILRAYIALDMQGHQPRMAAGMENARSMIMNNPHMTPDQKAQALASIGASMRNYQQMQDASAEDKAAVAPYRTRLDAAFDRSDRGQAGMNRRTRRDQGLATPAPGVSPRASGGPKGVKARLAKLKELYDAGLINKQEYDAKRSAILSEL